MVFVEYEKKDSFMHRLDPRSKLILLVTIGWLYILYLEPTPLIILLVMVIILGHLSKLPWRKVLKRISWLAVLITITFFVLSLWVTKPEMFTRIPRELASKVIFQITPPGTPFLGYLAITYGGLLYFTACSIKALLALLVACIFFYTTSQSDMIQLLSKLRVPHTVTFIIMAAIRFYPVISIRLQEIVLAQKSRGWQLGGLNPVKLIKSLVPLTIPAFSEAVILAERFAFAVQCRGYGLGKIGFLREFKFTKADYAFCTFLLFFTALMTILWYLYGVGML
ncbi:MAG: hypothetical protein DRK00_05760 [Thermoprotei archaeon]|nr:MAG: hypothetical protein DRK00_05760 [Thermoprotei archaeon]